jgi:hypothetical protein
MADNSSNNPTKKIVNLRLTPDGRAPENWEAFKFHIDNNLLCTAHDGIYLNEVLEDTRDGAMPPDPGDANTWLAAAAGRTRPQYNAAKAEYYKWKRANDLTVSYITASLHDDLQDEAVQHPRAKDLWKYLSDRFSVTNLTSMVLLYNKLFAMTLSQYDNAASFMTALNKAEKDITRAGGQLHTTLMASIILNAMEDRWPLARELTLNLPAA